eukprot:1967024-Alexandrium_andersonii.AAC.1
MARVRPGNASQPAASSGSIRGGAATDEEEEAAEAYHAELAEVPEPLVAVPPPPWGQWAELAASSPDSPIPRGCTLRDHGLYVD